MGEDGTKQADGGTAKADEGALRVVAGDRLCIKCGYNLVGQAIVREPHYKLFIARCPECGSVAALQEYPQLGRWASRWAAVLAAAWFVFCIVAMTASGAVIFGLSAGAHAIATESYSEYLYGEFNVAAQWPTIPAPTASAATMPGAGATLTVPGPGPGVVMSRSSRYWAGRSPAEVLERAGGLLGCVNWWGMSLMLSAVSFAALVIGCFWSAVLLARKAAGRCVFGLLVLVIACGFGGLVAIEAYSGPATYHWSAAQQEVGVPWLFISIGWAGLPLMLGLIMGRVLVRGMMRLLLPPRFRSSLAALWLADGLAAPKPR